MRNEKGITLIALVITIIVLLILAGISIAMLTGDNGLLTKSKQSAAATAVAGAKDEISLEFQKEMADYLKVKYTSGSTATQITNATPTAQHILDHFAGTTSATSATINGCYVTVSGSNIVVTYPLAATTTSAADFYSTGAVDSTALTLAWTDGTN